MELMRKFTVLGIIACGLINLYSCTTQESFEEATDSSFLNLSQEEYISIAFEHPKEITEDQAITLVKDFSGKQATRSISQSPIIEKKYYIGGISSKSVEDTVSSIPIYQLKLSEKEGFALVAGDERFATVIAFAEKGNLADTTQNKSVALMVREAENAIKSKLRYYNAIRDSLHDKTLCKLKTAFHTNDITYHDVKEKIKVVQTPLTRGQWIPEPTMGILVKEVKPMLRTEWGQNRPYNNELGYINNDIPKVVGCVGTAIAQIVAHYEAMSSVYGHTLDWNLIKERAGIDALTDDDIQHQVALLCKHVAYGIKTEWNMDGTGGASMTNSHKYLETMGVTFNLGKRNKGYDMDAAIIIASLDRGCPVLITGDEEPSETRSSGNKKGGHCWVLDGYQVRTRSTPTKLKAMIKSHDVYVHANFGWKGYASGYYMVDRNETSLSFDTRPVEGHYNQRLRLFPMVKRK